MRVKGQDKRRREAIVSKPFYCKRKRGKLEDPSDEAEHQAPGPRLLYGESVWMDEEEDIGIG